MFTLSETLGISYVVPTAKCDLDLSTFRKGILTSVSYLGIAMGLYLAGFLTDHYGRKTTIVGSVSMSLFFSTISALIPGFWPMVSFRLLTGIR